MATSRFAEQPRVSLPGSERKPFPSTSDAQLAFAAAGEPAVPAAEGDQLTVSVLLRRKASLPEVQTAGEHLSHEEFEQRFGTDPEALELLRAFAQEFDLELHEVEPAARATVQLTGTAERMTKAFGTHLEQRTAEGRMLRVRQGALTLPQELAPHVRAVLGLDDRPQAKAHFRVVRPRAAAGVSYTPVQVGTAYHFPSTGAAGQTIGIIELGGGYQTADLKTYFAKLGQATPTVTAVSVDKAKNQPGKDPNGADGEVLLDIEVAAAVAQGAHIAVYFAPNTDQGFVDAITTAVHDTRNKPSVISISWGGPESSWTGQAVSAMDEAFQAAASLGVSITVACGDNGSSDGVEDGSNHVDFPASSPHVLACGGTTLHASGGTISSETVWNELAANEGATGGGVSTLFAKPSWQGNANVPKPTAKAGGRGVPDVAGNADPVTGYQVRVDGTDTVIGGTSAVAPLWAGLIAVSNAANGKAAGFLNPALYAAKTGSAFRDITQGNNGGFAAARGWDPCTGLGSHIGTGVVTALKTSR